MKLLAGFSRHPGVRRGTGKAGTEAGKAEGVEDAEGDPRGDGV